MKLPKRVRILTRWYTVEIDNSISAYGQCHYHRQRIKINWEKCETDVVRRQTLWHEIGHAWAWESGISNNIGSQAEEFLVESFAALVVDLTGGCIRQRR